VVRGKSSFRTARRNGPGKGGERSRSPSRDTPGKEPPETRRQLRLRENLRRVTTPRGRPGDRAAPQGRIFGSKLVETGGSRQPLRRGWKGAPSGETTRPGRGWEGPIQNGANPMVGCRMRQACGVRAEKTVEVGRNDKDGTYREVAIPGRREWRAEPQGEADHEREWTLEAHIDEGAVFGQPHERSLNRSFAKLPGLVSGGGAKPVKTA